MPDLGKPQNERTPGALRKNEYIVIDTAATDIKPYSGISNTVCESARDALVIDGPGTGTIQSVCANARCPIHGNPDAPAPLTPEEQEAHESEWQKQQKLRRERAERARAKRLELLNSITGNFTMPLSTGQMRLLLMSLVHWGELDYAVERIVELYYAPQEGESEERMDQDILLSILESTDERSLFSVLIRLALAGHLEEPRSQYLRDRTREEKGSKKDACGQRQGRAKQHKSENEERRRAMSASPLLAFRGQTRFATPILRGGPYVNDCNHSVHLLAAVCFEQQGRFHALQLLTEYLARCAGRKRQIVDSEIKALWEFYEATWCELASAFPAKLVRSAKAAVERHAF
jgi:hypothetical protein